MYLHHLHMSCMKVELAKTKLIQLFGFQEYGIIPTKHVSHVEISGNRESIVLRLNSIYFILSDGSGLPCDTIDDLCFAVDSVEDCCNKAVMAGSSLLKMPVYLDSNGNIASNSEVVMTRAAIRSPIGNVIHTIITKHKPIEFLPGFRKTGPIKSYCGDIDFLDHIAFAVLNGESEKFMDWYDAVFSLKRFLSSNTEPVNGLIIRSTGGNGLRMLTLTGHPCNYMGVSGNESEVGNEEIKFVFGESLSNSGSDQILTFLKNHGQPGVQHIAFYTNSILNDASLWHKNGVSFIKPPRAYYKEIEKTLSALRERGNVDTLEDIGVLIDCEKNENKIGYLYQIFTKTVFDSNTFFFELIQRDNAKGFGVGNVSALWRALESHVQAST